MNKKFINKTIILYKLIVFLFLICSLPALTILFGLKIFCNESFYSVYLGAYTVSNIWLVIVEAVLLLIELISTFFINKDLKKVTLEYDKNLEENETVIKNYSKYSLEYYYVIPTFLAAVLSLLSHLDIYKECSTGLLFIIIIGIIQLLIGLNVFYNYIQYALFLESNNLKKKPKRKAY